MIPRDPELLVLPARRPQLLRFSWRETGAPPTGVDIGLLTHLRMD